MQDCEKVMTVEQMQDRAAWLEMRKKGVGGSDAAIVAGISKWCSPFELWAEKTGRQQAADISSKEAVHWGNVLEDVVAREFMERMGKKVQRCGMMRSTVYPFAFADVDRLVIGEEAGLECKTAAAWMRDAWKDGNIPPAYYAQVQHYMLVTGLPRWYVAVLIGGNHFEIREIERSQQDIEALLAMEAEFWQHVQDDEPPAIDGSDSCREVLVAQFPGGGASEAEPVALPAEAVELVEQLERWQDAEKAAKSGKAETQNKLCSLLGNNEAGLVAGRLVTWKPQTRRTVDSKRLKAEQPGIYEQYCKASSTRVFKVKG